MIATEQILAFGGSELLLGAGLFVVGVIGSLLLVGFVLVRLPRDYLLHSPLDHYVRSLPRGLSWLAIVAKNLVGLVVVAVGVVLSLPGIPGQGVLTILLGLMLLDFPGRRRFELWLLRRPSVRDGVDRLRARFHRQPLQMPEDTSYRM